MPRRRTSSVPPGPVTLPTPDGLFTACFTGRGLAALAFPGQTVPGDIPPAAGGSLDWLRLTEAALLAALAGRPPKDLPPLDWRGATAFQQRIWRVLLGIPAGRTCTYAALAARAGHPGASRAAGAACGANPIPVLVPCHRVIRSDGAWGGFSGGKEWKERLLHREGARP